MDKKVFIVVVAVIVFLTGCGEASQDSSATSPKPPIEKENVGQVVGGDIPEGCIVWFDGCNTCRASEPGAPMACTAMACFREQKPYCKEYEDGSSDDPNVMTVSPEIEKALKNATYNIEDEEVSLVEGVVEKEIASQTSSKIITEITSDAAEGDLQQGTLDGACILSQDPGGSGTFYYVGAVLEQSKEEYLATTNTYLLGDRIIVKEIKIEEGAIFVTYLTRKEEESMAALPTVEVKKKFEIEEDKLVEMMIEKEEELEKSDADLETTETSSEEEPEKNAGKPSAHEDSGETQLVGGDKDEHGCIASAGYTWSEEEEECVRPWENQ